MQLAQLFELVGDGLDVGFFKHQMFSGTPGPTSSCRVTR